MRQPWQSDNSGSAVPVVLILLVFALVVVGVYFVMEHEKEKAKEREQQRLEKELQERLGRPKTNEEWRDIQKHAEDSSRAAFNLPPENRP